MAWLSSTWGTWSSVSRPHTRRLGGLGRYSHCGDRIPRLIPEAHREKMGPSESEWSTEYFLLFRPFLGLWTILILFISFEIAINYETKSYAWRLLVSSPPPQKKKKKKKKKKILIFLSRRSHHLLFS